MNNRILMSAVVAGLLSLCSSLVLLFSGDGVKMFSDISQVQYAVALITSVATALAIIKAALTETPASDEKSRVERSQGGYCAPQFAGVLLVLVIALIAVPGCSQYAMTRNNTFAAASLTIEKLAVQIDQLQKTGQISNGREDKLLDELKQINADLRFAYQLVSPLQAQSLQAINERLTAMQIELAKEQP